MLKRIASIKASCSNRRVGIYYDKDNKTLCDKQGVAIVDGHAETLQDALQLAAYLWSSYGWEYRQSI